MTVYVDTMRAPFGRYVFCHMIADTEAELLAMADKIRLDRKHHQNPGSPRSHFDISRSKRALAVAHGAVEISCRELAEKTLAKRITIESQRETKK